MIDPKRGDLSIAHQCQLLMISRSTWYYERREGNRVNHTLMRLIDEQFMMTPYYGSRQMTRHLKRMNHDVGRKRIKRLMRLMGLSAIYQSPKTSRPHPEHAVYPYLLKGLEITQPNQVWCTDITYIPVKRGFLYLVAIMDWSSRKVLSWRISNTLDTAFCLEALKEAIALYGIPHIFNTDQGCQFTSFLWIQALKNHGIKISMDGKGRWMDNVFIERLWRSLKYECVYLHHFDNGRDAQSLIRDWMLHYNMTRPHSSFDGKTPHEVYMNMTTYGTSHPWHTLAA